MLPIDQIEKIVRAGVRGAIDSLLDGFGVGEPRPELSIDDIVSEIVRLIGQAGQPLSFDEVE